jgi:hypothetical protein
VNSQESWCFATIGGQNGAWSPTDIACSVWLPGCLNIADQLLIHMETLRAGSRPYRGSIEMSQTIFSFNALVNTTSMSSIDPDLPQLKVLPS